jgi:hypothetical protein
MKKSLILISVLGLCACMRTTDLGNGLTRLKSEPRNCEFLYTLDSSVTTYSIEEAYAYVEKTIVDQQSWKGDSYYVVNEEVVDNKGAVFGPDHVYKFKVKVYKCDK